MIKELNREIASCQACHLFSPDPLLKPLPGRGDGMDYLIVGMAPSSARIGLPEHSEVMPFGDQKFTSFLLGKVLDDVEWKINKTYITNLIKCSLPDNRKPTEEDLKICVSRFFMQEVLYFMPKLIVCLGNDVFDILDSDSRTKPFRHVKVFHHAYIARSPDKYNEWRNQWELLKGVS